MNTDSTPVRPSLRLVATGSRLAVGIAVAGALVVGTLLGVPAALPGVQATAARTVVTPDAGDTLLVCSGPFLALGRDASDALQMQAAGTARFTVGSDGEQPERTELAVPDVVGAAATPVYTVTADDGPVPLIDAAQSLRLRDDDLTGYAASACRPPSMQAWLVGGAASVGTSDVLTLANPGEVPSTVTVTTFGDTDATGRTLVVPAFTQIAVPLASAAIGASAPVVHVSADGAPVRAALQSSLVRTLDPGGIDLQDDAGHPDTDLVVAGVQVVGPRSGQAVASVRLMAPDADTAARVSIRLAGSGVDAAQPQEVSLAAGVPVEIDFPELPVGVYSVHVTAGEPVVAAVWQTSGFHPGSDFAWMTPAPEIDGRVMTTVPAGVATRLHIVGDDVVDRTVTITDLRSQVVREISVPAGSSTLVSLRNAASYAVESDAGIHAAVVMGGVDALAGWPLWPASGQPEPLVVYP
ncbi:DUF5719 family protein [Microbacterium sp. NIBRBAC000506063]|uniref:DUF5719 family protein n=1 Tax=Microbacterium sp. NIBRBAC000506063 TaxID=2734618 RepID=UPI001BB50453|nr:DUF5719 family protein [Microbacterium sp. NIBRBAC000506063]QTV79404.1 hypothetical protein KAE78_10695 [Microbacterium sp. NIBRBAC000506063]